MPAQEPLKQLEKFRNHTMVRELFLRRVCSEYEGKESTHKATGKVGGAYEDCLSFGATDDIIATSPDLAVWLEDHLMDEIKMRDLCQDRCLLRGGSNATVSSYLQCQARCMEKEREEKQAGLYKEK